jgi:hypothetical protein
MKRARVAALLAGAALAGVAYVVMSRAETREKALRLARTSGAWAVQGGKIAGVMAAKGGQAAGQWVRVAGEQYQAQAPRAAETLASVLPRVGVGKQESVSSGA